MTKEIKIRLDEHMVKKIDEMARAKRMSRNKFLKVHVDNLVQLNVFQKERNQFEEAIYVNTKVLDTFIQTEKNLVQRMQRLEEILLRVIEGEK